MFELTTCVVVKSNGRDCFGPIAEGATIPLCLDHMRVAYLYFADYLRSLRETTAQDREDLEKAGDEVLELRPRDLRPSAIYYVRMGDFIKIGVTRDLHNRMVALMPDEILTLESGDVDLERVRHLQFAALRAPKGREYFYPAAELMQHIRALQAVGWKPPRPPNDFPGYVRGMRCPSCDMIAVWFDGASAASCKMCGAVIDPTSIA